jgi:putative endonuclease
VNYAENTPNGRLAERLAESLLREKKYDVLARNWRSGKYEVDIIAREGVTLVFAEVKYRSGPFNDDPLLAVNRKKMKNLKEAAERWLETHPWKGELRFDVISIRKRNGTYEAEHISDAFSAGPFGFY